jgi:hypothetical protein
MPLSANTATVTILSEDSAHARVSLWLYQQLVGDEADVLKVNTATLSSRTVVLNATPVGKAFMQGEQITGGTSGAIGFVRDYSPDHG